MDYLPFPINRVALKRSHGVSRRASLVVRFCLNGFEAPLRRPRKEYQPNDIKPHQANRFE